MPQLPTLRAKGLVRTQNPLGAAPEGALSVADNAVVSRDGIVEARRGFSVWATIASAISIEKLFTYGGRLLAFYADISSYRFAYSDASFSSYTNYTGTFAQPVGNTPMRVAESNGNLYVTRADGVQRIDSVTGTPLPAGAPQGLDVEVTLLATAAGTALIGDARYAYRAVWGLRDANQNLILGAPSGRFVVTSPAVDITAGNMSRTANVVTATVAGHGFQVGDKIRLEPGEVQFPPGVKTITATTSTSFSYDEVGGDIVSTQTHRARLDTVDAKVAVAIPPGVTTSHFVQIYRSPASETAEVEPTDNLGLCFEKVAPSSKQISSLSRAGGVVTVTTSANHGFDVGAQVNIDGNTANFPGGVKLIASAPTSTTFTYSEAGTSTSENPAGSRNAIPLTIVFTDSLPDSLLGAALYTNPQEEGILASNTPPPVCRDLVLFRNSLVFANCDTVARLFVTLLACGSPLGVVEGDTFTLDGLTYTAGSSENFTTGQFKVFTNGTPAQNVANTAASICRTINRRPTNVTTLAYAISGPDDEPGRMVFERRTYGTSLTFTPIQHAAAWSPNTATTRNGETQMNAVYWSKRSQPDAVPLLQFQTLGSGTKAILRIVPTRDSLFILKQDGVWKMSGDGPDTFRFDQVDPTLELVAPETAVALDGTVFALTRQGVVRITETGVLVVSRDIEVDLAPLVSGPLTGICAELAFAVAYESDRKYHLWVPETVDDEVCTKSWTFDLFTEAWTTRSDPQRCGLLNPADQKMYLGASNLVKQERKNYDNTDYSDTSFALTINAVNGRDVTLASAAGVELGDGLLQGANFSIITGIVGNVVTVDRTLGYAPGAATQLTAIEFDVEWTPKFVDNPGALHHFKEATLLFDTVYFANASLKFASNVVQEYAEVPLSGEDLGFGGNHRNRFELRALITREQRRCSQLAVRFTHRQARSRAVIEGITIEVQPGQSPRVGK